MALSAHDMHSFHSHPTLSTAAQPRMRPKVSRKIEKSVSPSRSSRTSSCTVFDLLYDSYLPFRLYADYMLGSSPAELAKQFALPEYWVIERIEAVRLCGKQIRVNLLDSASQSNCAEPIG